MKLKDYKLVAMAFALKQWRISNDISLYRISKILNIDAHTLARVENAENVHSEALLRYIEFIADSDPTYDIFKEWKEDKEMFKNMDKQN